MVLVVNYVLFCILTWPWYIWKSKICMTTFQKPTFKLYLFHAYIINKKGKRELNLFFIKIV